MSRPLRRSIQPRAPRPRRRIRPRRNQRPPPPRACPRKRLSFAARGRRVRPRATRRGDLPGRPFPWSRRADRGSHHHRRPSAPHLGRVPWSAPSSVRARTSPPRAPLRRRRGSGPVPTEAPMAGPEEAARIRQDWRRELSSRPLMGRSIHQLLDAGRGACTERKYGPNAQALIARPRTGESVATKQGWSNGNGGCDDSMKLRSSSSGCETRPARGEPVRAGSEPVDGHGNATGGA